MKKNYRKGVFFVVYSFLNENEISYLLLKRKLHWKGWEFPKAGIEKNETLNNCVKRELKEETGLKPSEIKKFNISGDYTYDKEIKNRKGINGQTFECVYAIRVNFNNEINISSEHSDFMWANFEEAYNLLTWNNQKQALKEVHKYLLRKNYNEIRINFTSLGKVLFSGKNDKTNEKLIRNYVNNEDIVFHTSKPGSSFVVIKSDNVSKKDIKDAAIFCAKHSQDWRDNKSSVSIHYFRGKDILKRKGMKIGSFNVSNFKELLINKKDILNYENQ